MVSPDRCHRRSVDGAAPTLHERTILVAEDDGASRLLLETILARQAGVRVLAAADGDTALGLIREQRPDLILIDLHLPGRDGDDVMVALAGDERSASIPVVLISADPIAASRCRAKGVKPTACLEKPVDVPRLIRLVDELTGACAPAAAVTTAPAAPAAEPLLATIVEASPLAIVAIDRQGVVRTWNRAAERMFGWSALEVVGGPLRCVPDGEKAGFAKGFHSVLAGQTLEAAETTRLRKDGALLDVSLSLAPWRNDAGKIVGVVGVIADASAQKRAEAKLAEQLAGEARGRAALSAIVDSSPLAIVAIDSDAQVTTWNAAAEQMFGWSAAEVIGGPTPHVPHEAMDGLNEVLQRLADGEPVIDEEVTRQRKDGTAVDLKVSYAPVKDVAGEVTGFMSLALDISDRKAAEASLAQRNRELGALHELALELIAKRSVDEVLGTIVADAAGLLEAPYGYVYLWNTDTEQLVSSIAYGGGQRFIGAVLAPGEGLAGRAFEQGETLVVDDYRSWPGRSVQFDDESLRTVVAVPLRTEAGPVGVLGIAYYESRQLGTDVELIERFGDLASLALESARLNDELTALLAREQGARASLTAVVEASPISIVAAGLDKRVTMWNPAAERIFGWSAEEVLGQLPPHVPLEELSAEAGPQSRALTGENVVGLDAVRLRKDGSTVETRVFLGPLRDETGAVTGFMGLTQDVTEEKRAERELRRSREQLSLALEAAHMGCWERWPGSVNPVWSPELERIYGLDSGSFSGRQPDFLALVHPEDREMVDGAIHASLDSRDDLSVDFRVIRPDGELRWFNSRGRWMSAEVGSPRLMGMTTDVTDQKRAETELRQAEERYRSLVEQLPAVTYVDLADPAGAPLYVSPQVESVLGVSPESWLAASSVGGWVDLVHADDRELVSVSTLRCAQAGEPIDIEFRVPQHGGHVQWFRELARFVPGTDGTPAQIHGLMLDITPLKRAQLELEESYRRLERADEHRRLLLSRLVRAQEEERQHIATDIHDDSVQVLTALALRLELLRDCASSPDLRETFDATVDTARQAITRLRRLIFELRPPALDRDGLAAALRVLLQQLHEETGVDTVLHDQLDSEPDQAVRAILYRISQEAITNAAKHAGPATVTVTLKGEPEGFRVTVADDGAGFDTAAYQERFGHMGLSSMRERAEMAGGTCAVRSEPGQGTTVEAFVPSPAVS